MSSVGSMSHSIPSICSSVLLGCVPCGLSRCLAGLGCGFEGAPLHRSPFVILSFQPFLACGAGSVLALKVPHSKRTEPSPYTGKHPQPLFVEYFIEPLKTCLLCHFLPLARFYILSTEFRLWKADFLWLLLHCRYSGTVHSAAEVCVCGGPCKARCRSGHVVSGRCWPSSAP